MRALTIDAHGGLEQLRYRTDLPAPVLPGPGYARVRVHAAALNRLDLWTLGGLPGVTITPPWVLGADAVGTVTELLAAPDAGAPSPARVGDRVLVNPGIACRACDWCRRGEQSLCVRFGLLGEHHPGTLAEEIVVPAANLRPCPAGVSDADAAAYTLATLTAWRMCVTRARVAAGDRVLIWGIGGGVALAALQICKARGAEVLVTSSSADKLARARAMGADDGLDRTMADLGIEVRKRTGRRGVDVIIDSTGQETWAQSLIALARGGRVVTCGGTSGPELRMDVRRLFWHQWTIMGSTMGNDAELDAVVGELAAGRLRSTVDSVHALADGRTAFERLHSGAQFGKVVVQVQGG